MSRIFALAGIMGGAVWIWLVCFGPEWSTPGTDAYIRYEFWNRLFTPAMAGMAVGLCGLALALRASLTRIATIGFATALLGFALMILGNVAEFWMFTNLPYSMGEGQNLRDVAAMTTLFGTLLMLLSVGGAGLGLLNSDGILKWLGLLLILPLPLTLIGAILHMSWTALPIGGLSIIIGSITGLQPPLDKTKRGQTRAQRRTRSALP
ncbi:MAG TPA: hypothetical protein VFD70_08045 [Anaerolineae bacterium]|nr:hypothetical protein [Anaerolineae bacterium]